MSVVSIGYHHAATLGQNLDWKSISHSEIKLVRKCQVFRPFFVRSKIIVGGFDFDDYKFSRLT